MIAVAQKSGPYLFGVRIHRVTMEEAVREALRWIQTGDPAAPCRYIVTPNVNHAVLLQHREDLVAAYREASLVLADGWPLVTVSRLAGDPLPERVTGSDFVPQIFTATADKHRLKVFFLGAGPGVGELAAVRAKKRWPHLEIVGVHSPPRGFEADDAENRHIIGLVNQARPDLLVVGLGAPKQEIWLRAHSRDLRCKVAIAAGGTIDFLAGKQTRAPRWIQNMRMEWCFRMATDPRRLGGRYARDALLFPTIAAREIFRARLRRDRWRSNGDNVAGG